MKRQWKKIADQLALSRRKDAREVDAVRYLANVILDSPSSLMRHSKSLCHRRSKMLCEKGFGCANGSGVRVVVWQLNMLA